jgi:hypothetical protein
LFAKICISDVFWFFHDITVLAPDIELQFTSTNLTGGSIMKSVFQIWIPVLLFASFISGCSGSGDSSNPVMPDDPEPSPAAMIENSGSSDSLNHMLLDYYLIHIDASDPDDIQAEMVPVRLGALHLNILKLLETGICTDCFKLVGLNIPEPGILDVDIMITHPFDDLKFTIFDVRGIMMFNGSQVFPASGLKMSNSSIGNGELLNAEGYTQLYKGSTLGQAGDFLTYYKGKFATPSIPNADLNGFIRHITNSPSNTRNALYPADSVTQMYSLALPSGPFVFGYAVDASWDIPTADPVTDPMTQFPVTANCLEPWKLNVQEEPIGDGLTNEGGQTKLIIDVYDWQGQGSHAAPLVECPALFNGSEEAVFTSSGPGYSRYEVTVSNSKLTSGGYYRCLISVEDNANATSPDFLDLTAYNIINLYVREYGWAQTWGGSLGESCYDVAISSSGNIYATGSYTGTVDFDPGPGVEQRISQKNIKDEPTADIFLSCFNATGNFQWVRVWGGGESESGFKIAVDDGGNIYVTGFYMSNVDFDPGTGSDVHMAFGNADIFLSKFDSSGNFQWAKTWGGAVSDSGFSVALDGSGGIYVTGNFEGTVDFDPGGGTDTHNSNGSGDIYLVKFNSSGAFQWAQTWGGDNMDSGSSVAADSSGQVYVSGYFRASVDFDPSPGGTIIHTTKGGADVFLSVFDTSGSFLRAYTWGGQEDDFGNGITVDGSDNVFCVGSFRFWADLDPTEGSKVHISEGAGDAFLIKLNSSGIFQWSNSWGGVLTDFSQEVAVDDSSNVFATGKFREICDFDSGDGVDNHTSGGGDDVFLSKFDSSGNFQWAQTWGSSGHDYGTGVVADSPGNSYVVGDFNGAVDFDTSSGNDVHSSNGLTDIFLCKYTPYGTW